MERMVKTMFRKIIDIYKDRKTGNLPLFPMGQIVYPTIPDNTSNFCTDYLTKFDSFDVYVARMWGQRNFDAFLSPTKLDSMTEWEDAVIASINVHLDEWARLYYALSIKYNPIWNVDGTTSREYGERVRTEDIAERTRTDTTGKKKSTNTDYATAYDSGSEKETGKSVFEDDENEFESVDDAHMDTFTDETYTDTETRSGNIGVTMTQQLLQAEFELRKRSFFRTIFKQIIDDCGCYYMEGEWA